jgi:hypothetical protein
MATDSSILKLDMGDLGTLGFDQGSGAFGISTLENKVPTAYEEADHVVGTLGHGIDAVGNTNVIGYSNTISGVGISLQYNPDTNTQTFNQAGATNGGGSTGSNWNMAVTLAVPEVDGLTLAAGYSDTDNKGVGTTDNEEILNNSVIEFSYDNYTTLMAKQKRWKPLRVRHDKNKVYNFGLGEINKTANSYFVAMNIWRSITNEISTDMICGKQDIDTNIKSPRNPI